MIHNFTNAERCKRRRIKREYEMKVAEYYARGGMQQNMKLPYNWTDEQLNRRIKIINDYHPTFLGQTINPSLLVQQLAKLINNSEKPALTFCHLGTQIIDEKDRGLPSVIIGMLQKAYCIGLSDIFFTPAGVVELLKNILTLEEMNQLKEML